MAMMSDMGTTFENWMMNPMMTSWSETDDSMRYHGTFVPCQ